MRSHFVFCHLLSEWQPALGNVQSESVYRSLISRRGVCAFSFRVSRTRLSRLTRCCAVLVQHCRELERTKNFNLDPRPAGAPLSRLRITARLVASVLGFQAQVFEHGAHACALVKPCMMSQTLNATIAGRPGHNLRPVIEERVACDNFARISGALSMSCLRLARLRAGCAHVLAKVSSRPARGGANVATDLVGDHAKARWTAIYSKL